jgi:hypothetical protein
MWAVDPEILRRIEPIGVLSRIRNAQNAVLNSLLNSSRFARLAEQEAIDGSASYAPADFLSEVRRGVWKELEGPQVKIDAYRRNLQRAYLDLLNNKINSQPPPAPAGVPAELAPRLAASGDEKPLYRAELRALNASIATSLARAFDKETRAHLDGARDQIAKILDPKFVQPPAAGQGTPTQAGIDEFDPFSAVPNPQAICWPDYVIRPE